MRSESKTTHIRTYTYSFSNTQQLQWYTISQFAYSYVEHWSNERVIVRTCMHVHVHLHVYRCSKTKTKIGWNRFSATLVSDFICTHLSWNIQNQTKNRTQIFKILNSSTKYMIRFWYVDIFCCCGWFIVICGHEWHWEQL